MKFYSRKYRQLIYKKKSLNEKNLQVDDIIEEKN